MNLRKNIRNFVTSYLTFYNDYDKVQLFNEIKQCYHKDHIHGHSDFDS